MSEFTDIADKYKEEIIKSRTHIDQVNNDIREVNEILSEALCPDSDFFETGNNIKIRWDLSEKKIVYFDEIVRGDGGKWVNLAGAKLSVRLWVHPCLPNFLETCLRGMVKK